MVLRRTEMIQIAKYCSARSVEIDLADSSTDISTGVQLLLSLWMQSPWVIPTLGLSEWNISCLCTIGRTLHSRDSASGSYVERASTNGRRSVQSLSRNPCRIRPNDQGCHSKAGQSIPGSNFSHFTQKFSFVPSHGRNVHATCRIHQRRLLARCFASGTINQDGIRDHANSKSK